MANRLYHTRTKGEANDQTNFSLVQLLGTDALMREMSDVKSAKSRLRRAIIIAAFGLYWLLTTILLIRQQEISIGKSIFAKTGLVLEILLVLFVGAATWLGEIPLVLGLLLGSLLAADALAPITRCSTLLYVNVVLSICLVLYAFLLYRRESRKRESDGKR